MSCYSTYQRRKCLAFISLGRNQIPPHSYASMLRVLCFSNSVSNMVANLFPNGPCFTTTMKRPARNKQLPGTFSTPFRGGMAVTRFEVYCDGTLSSAASCFSPPFLVPYKELPGRPKLESKRVLRALLFSHGTCLAWITTSAGRTATSVLRVRRDHHTRLACAYHCEHTVKDAGQRGHLAIGWRHGSWNMV
jgi:hypothetical protein